MLLITSSFATAGLAQENIAFRRAVYQSGSLDFNHTGQLVTDGIYTVDDFVPPTAWDDYGDCKMDERPDNLFDGKAETLWITHHVPNRAYIKFTDGEPRVASSYSLTSNLFFSNRDPRSWTVEGSVDGEKYIILDTRENEEFTGRNQTRVFDIRQPGNYRYYRLSVAEAGRKDLLHIAEWDLLDSHGNSVVPRKTIDENIYLDSRWISPNDGSEHWIYVDLGERSVISGMELTWNKENRAKKYEIQFSDDAVNWTTVHTGNAVGKNPDAFELRGAPSRYVRLYCKESTGDRFELIEMKVMGSNSRTGEQTPPMTQWYPIRDIRAGNWKLERASRAGTGDGRIISSREYDDSGWLAAQVPGTVLYSYLLAGAIPDPNYGARQIMISDSYFTADFWYRNVFVTPRVESNTRVWLNFDAVNWKAEIYLNGNYIGRMDGAFTRGRFDITEYLSGSSENYLAVLVRKNDTPGPVTLQDVHSPGLNGGILGADSPTIHASVGWDWVPTIRGRNIGIYGEVHLSYSRDVLIRDPWVKVDMDVENRDFSQASLTVLTELHNASAMESEVVVEGEIIPGNIKFRSEKFILEPGESREVTVAENIIVNNPQLWWPNTYGEQFLYTAKLRADTDGATSDQKEFQFGVRKFTYKEDYPMTIYCNGTRIVCRGGNWGMDDSNLAATARDYDIKVRLHAEANLTMIRNWVGMTGNEEFYRACDRYGILIWDDFWLANPSDGPDPADEEMFMANAVDKVKRNRHHASLALYCGRNEGDPPASLNSSLDEITRALDGTRIYIPHSAAGTVTGFGPYTVQDNDWYFKNTGPTLHSERGMPNVPALESLLKMLPPENRWPIDDVWGIHDFTEQGAQDGANFISKMERYGRFDDIESFTRTAQLVNYEGHKSMFEAVYANGSNGMIMWMSQSAWPSMVWQTYDYYYDTNAGYFGIKKANQPLNVIYNHATREFILCNTSGKEWTDLNVYIKLSDINGKSLSEEAFRESAGSDSRKTLKTINPEAVGIIFLTSWITDGEGNRLADNFGWINATNPYDFKEFSTLGQCLLKVSAVKTGDEGEDEAVYRFNVENRGNSPALSVRIKTVSQADGCLVTPAYYSDNYFSLMPGQSVEITARIPGRYVHLDKLDFLVEGWNVIPAKAER